MNLAHSTLVYSKSAALLLLLSLAVACGKNESGIKVEDFKKPGTPPVAEGAQEVERPKMKVSLPSPPPASAFVVPERNNDGTLRVRGLIHFQDKYIDKEENESLTITGVISYVSPQCDPKKAKAEGRTCLKPNLFIKDDVDSTKSLQVVGFPFEFVKKLKLEPGQQHVFRGKYVKKSNGFINSGDGLLELIAIDDSEVRPEKP